MKKWTQRLLQQQAVSQNVSSAMPGTLKMVIVKKGDIIKYGDVLFIIEAMKLENEIMAPCAGTVTFVGASESGMVNPGDVLCIIA